jgi:selenocysteine lyase/cysteine desulfurase
MPKAELYELAREYRPQFPIFKSSVYMSSCSLGALSEKARAALDEFADLWDRYGASAWYEPWIQATSDVRALYARLIGADERECFLAPSVSGALATISSAIDFESRPKVITTELDFPTLVYQYLAKSKLGIETVVLESPDGISVPLDAFADAVDDRTALVATSQVYFTTGAIQDVAAIARLAHDRGALCLIDAYQSIGQLPVNAREVGADFLLTGGLKWLLGGTGLAYGYVRGELIDSLDPTVVSWFGVENQFAFDRSGLELRGDAQRFELGTPAVPTLYTARAGLEMVLEIGVERIRQRDSSLTEDLVERAAGAGLSVRGAGTPERRSAIIMVEQADAADAVGRLSEAGVICDYRLGAVRLSPHFYNTTEDNEAAISVLAD